MRSQGTRTDGGAPYSARIVAGMRRYHPFTSAILSRALGHRTLRAAASRVTEIAPAETSWMPGILMLDEDRAAVTAAQHETTLAHEWERVAGYLGTHRATLRFELRNALVTPKGVFTARDAFHRAARPSLGDLLSGPDCVVDAGCYPSTGITNRYFGHWACDALATAYLRGEGETLTLRAPPEWSHAEAYLRLLGIDAAQGTTLFRRLSLYDDVGMNANRRARLARLKHDIRKHLPTGPRRRIFLSRGSSGVARTLSNQREVAARLSAEGFEVLDLAQPLDELLGALVNATTVVSMEGSHCAHAILAAPRDWSLVIINPADRFNNLYADYMPALGGRLATMVAERDGDGYRADTDRLMRLIERAEAADRYLGMEG